MKLNESQRVIAECLDSSFFVKAPAGTGKTRVAIERVVNICKEHEPESILNITFTNKACRELESRVAQEIPEMANRIKVATFHSYCYTILQEFSEYASMCFPVQIADNDDVAEIISEYVTTRISSKYQFIGSELGRFISKVQAYRIGNDAKPMQLAKQVVEEVKTGKFYVKDGLAKEVMIQHGEKIYRYYLEYMHSCNLVDFNDLIRETLKVLKEKDVCRELYHRYKFIQIDEVQDTSEHEFEILKAIITCGGEVEQDKYINTALYGDMNQCIYTWRDAKPKENIEAFHEMFSNAKDLQLDVNYRSTQKLIELGQSYLKRNGLDYFNVEARSEELGEDIEYFEGRSSKEELDRVKQIVQSRKDLGSTAILVRTNLMAKKVYEALKNDINVVCVDHLKMFGKKSVRDVIAMLKYCVNPNNDMALRRMMKSPVVGVDLQKMAALDEMCEANGVSLCDVAVGRNYNKLVEAYENNAIMTFDVEATGTSFVEDEVIQIAAIVGGKDGVKAVLDVLVKNDKSVGSSYHVHGFSDEYLAQHGKSKEEAFSYLLEFIEKNNVQVYCGHNVQFDIRMLQQMGSRLGKEFKCEFADVFDTLALATKYVKNVRNYKLGTLAEYFGTEAKPNHNAYFDILATFQVLEFLMGEMNNKVGLENLANGCKEVYVKGRKYFEIVEKLVNESKQMGTLKFIGYLVNSCLFDDIYKSEVEYLRLLYKVYRNLYKEELTDFENRVNLLEFSALHANQIQESEVFKGCIPIITAHTSKGLEFETVFAVGLDADTFPNRRTVRIKEQLDEDTRLMYVVITRAKKRLYLSNNGTASCLAEQLKELCGYHKR